MSLNIGAVILAIISGVLAYISYLRNQLEKHQNENAMLKSAAQQNEWKAQIEASKVKVNESTKDYDTASNDFRTKYPDDGSPK